MSRSEHRQSTRRRQRRLAVRAVRRSDPDAKRMSRALIAVALEQAAAEAAAEKQRRGDTEASDG